MEIVSFIKNSFLNSTTYLISSNNELYLIDCGDSKPIIDYIKTNKLILKGVFLTHTHFDHIYGLNDLLTEYPNLIVYTSEFGRQCLYSEKLNLSYYHETPFCYNGNTVTILNDGDKIHLSDSSILNVIETPGHCPSCLTYYFDRFIFTGDSYIPGLKVVTNLPRSNKKDAAFSLKRIKAIAINKKIYSGH